MNYETWCFIETKLLCSHLSELPWWLSSKEPACQYSRFKFDPWVQKISLEKEMQPTLVFLPGESHGQRDLAGYSPWGSGRVRHDLVTKTTATTHLLI